MANIYLDALDHEMAEEGREMVRYADDLVILCRSEEEARGVLERLKEWMAEAGLELHPEKTTIVDAREHGGFEFLGWSGDLAGRPNPASVTMATPVTAGADFQLVYAIGPRATPTVDGDRVFVQGAMIGWAGVLIGIVLGVVLAIYVPVIAPFLEQLLGFQIMPGDVYYVTRIPSELEWQDVWVIGIAAFVLTSLATLYPARRAALVNPAAALRYE